LAPQGYLIYKNICDHRRSIAFHSRRSLCSGVLTGSLTATIFRAMDSCFFCFIQGYLFDPAFQVDIESENTGYFGEEPSSGLPCPLRFHSSSHLRDSDIGSCLWAIVLLCSMIPRSVINPCNLPRPVIAVAAALGLLIDNESRDRIGIISAVWAIYYILAIVGIVYKSGSCSFTLFTIPGKSSVKAQTSASTLSGEPSPSYPAAVILHI